MAIPILKNWKTYFTNSDEGLGSSYERIVLNKKLATMCKHFHIKKALETPSFGFTGLSGINSVFLAQQGIDITLMDNNKSRIGLIKKTWNELNLPVNIEYSSDFRKLPFENNAFDLSWNFSALWFVDDILNFLAELSRVTSKAIFICVPNRTGLGYLFQKMQGKKELKTQLKEENIIPKNFIRELKKLGWMLIDNKFIDCPPWPDIGMPKEKFLKIFGLHNLLKKKKHNPISIMNYYSGENPQFPEEMMKHYWFEKKAPSFIKHFWAHHKYFLFIPSTEK